MRLVLTIGWNTLREVVRHPVYYVVVGLFVLLCSLSYVLNVFQLHEDVTGDVLQMGVASMSLCALCLAAIGSSRVMIRALRCWLIYSMRLAMVVDLPLPVTPVIRQSPCFNS